MKSLNLILGIAFLLTAIGLAFYYNPILEIFAVSFKLGWVFSAIFIRVLVTLLFIFSLRELFAFFRKKSTKFWIISLIGIVPGFFLSFISVPIYTVDYGMLNDGFVLEKQQELNSLTNGGFTIDESEHTVVAFFTTSCPFCKAACKKLALNVEAGQKVPVQLIFPGKKEDMQHFIEENNGTGFKAHNIDDDGIFMSAAGQTFPSIFVVNKSGETLYHWSGDEMNYSALDYLIELKQ